MVWWKSFQWSDEAAFVDGCLKVGEEEEKICVDHSIWKTGYEEKGRGTAVTGASWGSGRGLFTLAS